MEEDKEKDAEEEVIAQAPRPTHGFTNVSPISVATSLAESSRTQEQQAQAAAAEKAEKKGWFGRRK